MAKAKNIDALFAEMMGLVGSAPKAPKARPVRSRKTRRAHPSPARIARLERALARKEPLPAVRALIPDEGNPQQMVVARAFACLLETDSAGLSILFDRFTARERKQLRASLEQIGATRTVAAFDRIARADATARRRIDRSRAGHVAEIESKLLRYCREHVEALAAV